MYVGHFSYGDVQSMPVGERDWHFVKLGEIKKKEKEEHDKANRDMAAKRSTKSRSPGAFRPGRR